MKLHWTTWVFVALGIMEVLATLWANASGLRQATADFRWGRSSAFEFLGFFIPSFFYALNWFGTAAMVEFLYRIWMELKRSNDAKGVSSRAAKNDE